LVLASSSIFPRVSVGQFLNFIQTVTLVVFGNFLIFEHFFQASFEVVTHVANGDFMFFGDFVTCLASCGGVLRSAAESKANHFAVVRRINPRLAAINRFFDRADLRRVPRLNVSICASGTLTEAIWLSGVGTP
jgi:hypothetical protein